MGKAWTEEQVAILTQGWAEGASASQIAKRIPGMTRNAIIGKADRMQLASRRPGGRLGVKLAPRKPRDLWKRAAAEQAKVETVKSAPVPVPVIVAPPEPEPVSLVSLLDLRKGQCHWPSGDPKKPGFGFCGHTALKGKSYCAEHHALGTMGSIKAEKLL